MTVTAHTDSGPGKKSDVVFGITKSGGMFINNVVCERCIGRSYMSVLCLYVVPKGPPEHVQLTLTKSLLIGFWNPPVNPNGNITHYFVQLKNSRSGHVANYTVHVSVYF